MKEIEFTKEAIENYCGKSNKPLRDLCNKYDIAIGEKATKPTMRALLLQKINKKETSNYKLRENNYENSQYNAFEKNEKPKILKKDISEIDVKKAFVDNSTLALLPVTIDELIQFWQRGFVCHPNVIKYLAEKTCNNHNSSELIYLEKINLNETYETNCKIYINFNFEKIKNNKIINAKWIASFSLVKNIIVHSEESYEKVTRSLRNSNRGWNNSDFKIKTTEKRSQYKHSIPKTIERKVESKTKYDFELLDSLLGSFALSSFMEKQIFFNNTHQETKIYKYGSLCKEIIDNDQTELSKISTFICSSLKDSLKYSVKNSNEVNYIHKVFDLIRERNNEEIERLVINYHARDSSKISPFELNKIQNNLKEGLITNAVKNITGRPRDPILIFYCLLDKFKNTDNTSASDKQSFLMTITKFYSEDKILSFDEAILLTFFLGYYIGYSACWNPVIKKELYEWENGDKFLKLLFSQNELDFLISKSLQYTDLIYITNNVNKNGTILNEEVYKSKKNIKRNISKGNNKIILNDEILQKFASREKESNILLAINILINYNSDILGFKEFYDVYMLDKSQKNKQIFEKLKNGILNDTEREIISAILELNQ